MSARLLDYAMPKVSDSVSYRMKAVRVSGTGPELRVRRIASLMGLRYQVNVRSVPGRPDLASKKSKWAVFVHGCFWHGHSCKRGRCPKTNAVFWKDKIRENRMRDRTVARQLRAGGFRVITIWQCELDNEVRVMNRLSTLAPVENKSGVRTRSMN
jgi:DNA mismatch endonuclease (patch repair protein)